MKCSKVKNRLSEYLDEELSTADYLAMRSHLDSCRECARQYRSLQAAISLVRESPRLRSIESIASRVANRLEIERRGPGLALLFRPAWKARPLIFPSLVPAALVLVSILAGFLALDREPREAVMTAQSLRWEPSLAPTGTESNPLFLSASVVSPQIVNAAEFDSRVWDDLGEDSVFLETVVARDGSVSTVTVLSGDRQRSASLVDVLRNERFEPGRYHGRPVAVSLYRLISSVEVRASRT